jgi:hypothetical protein
MEILAPTLLEYCAVQLALLAMPCTLPHARVSRVGVRLAHWKGARQGSVVVVCGLAGALASGLPPGTVLIPERVGLVDGRSMSCDPVLVQALVTAALTLRFRPDTRPLVTAPSLIVGNERDYWFRQGFVAVDMETGLLMGQNLRVATIRVVLDSPEYGISPDWLRPTRALLQPSLWPELFWLVRVAPQYALRAAHVLKVALGSGPDCRLC